MIRLGTLLYILSAALMFTISPFAAFAQSPDPLAVPPGPAQKYAASEGGVDMRTGQYIYSSTDLSSNGVGSINFERTNGVPDWRYWNVMGQFTNNWHIFATYKPIKDGSANFTIEGARGQQFIAGANTNNFFAAAANAKSTLHAVPTGPNPLDRYLVYTASDGTKITFREQQEDVRRLQSSPGQYRNGMLAAKIEHPDGSIYTLSYDPPSGGHPTLLRRVTSNTGHVLILEWALAAGWKMISKACLFNASMEDVPATNSCASSTYSASYGYGANGYMTSSTDAGGNMSTYASTYSAAGWQAARNAWPNTHYTWTNKFYEPGSNTPYLTNTMYRYVFYEYVQSQDFTAGADYTYSWNIVEHHEAEMEVAGGTATRNDGSSVAVQYQTMRRPGYTYGDSYVVSEGPKRIIDELGRELNSDYCINIFVGGKSGCAAVSARYWIYPEGNRSDFTYNGWGSVLSITDKGKPGSGVADITHTFTYDCTAIVHCRSPITATDGKGNMINVLYSPIHGGVLKKTLPADASGVRPETRYSYAQRHAWLKSGSGYAQALTPVWVLVSEDYCRTSSADVNGNCSAGASDKVVTTYDYGPNSGPNNLWLRGIAVTADGQTLRTCYGYDGYGRKISETQPRAGLASCP